MWISDLYKTTIYSCDLDYNLPSQIMESMIEYINQENLSTSKLKGNIAISC